METAVKNRLRFKATKKRKVTIYKVVAVKKNGGKIPYSIATGIIYRVGKIPKPQVQHNLCDWGKVLDPNQIFHTPFMYNKTSGFIKKKVGERWLERQNSLQFYNSPFTLKLAKMKLSGEIIESKYFHRYGIMYAGSYIEEITIL